MLAMGLYRSERGFEKVVELVGVCVEGDGSESANSSVVSISEIMPDDVLACGESSGGKAKSGIKWSGFWRLAGWEVERWSDPTCLLIVG